MHFWVGPYPCLQILELEVTDCDKRSSLFRYSINYNRKTGYCGTPLLGGWGGGRPKALPTNTRLACKRKTL